MQEELKEKIETAFSVPIEPIDKSFFYKSGLAVAAVFMVLLFALYIVIIGAVGGGVYYAVMGCIAMIKADEKSIMATVYIVTIIGGSLVLVFMIIPLIPRFRKKDYPLYRITEENEPLFYELIEQICRTVGSPMPKEIAVIMEPNAYAALRRGWMSIFYSGDLELAIGLPLIHSLSVQKLSGVIAHEMGHFTQGTGMRLAHLIHFIQRWFFRAVYEPNAVQDFFEKSLSKTWDFRIQLLMLLSMLFVWITKLVLMGLMTIGYIVSNFMSRQMEYDADQYEFEIAGSRAFESTMYSIVLLNIAYEHAYYMSMMTLQESVLCEDLAGLMKAQAKMAAAKQKEEIINSILEPDTKVMDTHPSMRDRIARAKRKNVSGICPIQEAVADLFRNFKILSVNLTKSFYTIQMEEKAEGLNLMKVEDYLKYFLENRHRFGANTHAAV